MGTVYKKYLIEHASNLSCLNSKVLLNIPEEWRKIKVYNDINKDLYVTFKVLHDAGKRARLTKMLNHAFPHETIFQELKESEPEDDIETARKG